MIVKSSKGKIQTKETSKGYFCGTGQDVEWT
jgi:hypothetical protein